MRLTRRKLSNTILDTGQPASTRVIADSKNDVVSMTSLRLEAVYSLRWILSVLLVTLSQDKCYDHSGRQSNERDEWGQIF
ncbi:hypothetical protein Y032_0148g2672 [Ancylostoma ceylanicum]|uniref:Uncharacterized protein n=1 Tax=Ancylostoma ceylanicum TaxID=53326 RepID=A0A016T147_9BILA|nr:hypothetical protein Y032_0148g2672 [Ancylostoma ceylanicum]